MKILHVVIDGQIGGGQLVARKLAEGARARGHEAALVSTSRGPFTDLAERDGIPVRYANVSRLHRIGGLAELRAIIRRERADLVHTHGMAALNVLSRVAARSTGVAVVSHMHTPNVFRSEPVVRTLYRTLDNLTARMCARLIAVCEDTRRRLIEQGIDGELIETVYNGFDPPEPPPEPAPPPPGLDGLRLVACVGRLDAMKGQDLLLEALARVSGVGALVVGRDVDGACARLERRSAELGIQDRVAFLGPRADVLSLVAACELLVLPSRTEAFPLAPMEAMALRKPVVAFAVGGVPELVDAETGVLVPPGDVLGLADALASVLADPDRARALGQAGYRRLRERFTEERMVRRVLEISEEALR